MKKYILTASTTKYGWSFTCEGLSYKEYKAGDELPTGLFYIFESENDETAMRDADKFAWYFEQEYVGEDNIDWHYPSKQKENVLYSGIIGDAIRRDDYSEIYDMIENGEIE